MLALLAASEWHICVCQATVTQAELHNHVLIDHASVPFTPVHSKWYVLNRKTVLIFLRVYSVQR